MSAASTAEGVRAGCPGEHAMALAVAAQLTEARLGHLELPAAASRSLPTPGRPLTRSPEGRCGGPRPG
jgi:hypothetical protein